MVNIRSDELNVTVAGKDVIIRQSPTLLRSSRKQGTTGACVWKVTPLFADWIASPSNVFFQVGILSPQSVVLELGSGVSGIVCLALGPVVKQYIASDQEYVLRILRENISANRTAASQAGLKGSKRTSKAPRTQSTQPSGRITVVPLDWETDSAASIVESTTEANLTPAIDVLIACDCVYNEALIEPFVNTCAEIASLRTGSDPTIVVVAQQLRSSDVCEAWIRTFHSRFRVWRMPDKLLPPGLQENSGFVVHVGVLRDTLV